MQALDTVFFQAETPPMPMNVIGALVLDPAGATRPWGYDTVLELLGERLHLLAAMRWKAVPVPAGLDQPRWIEDPDFDLTNHVTRAELDEPKDLAALAKFVSGMAGKPLRRDRPLWEMFVIDDMEDGSVALVAKLHHAFMDGGAGMEVIGSLFDLDPAGGGVAGPDHPWKPEEPPSRAQLLAQSPQGALARLTRLPGLARTTAGMVARAVITEEGQVHKPDINLAPNTIFNGSLTQDRAVAFARCSLDDVRAIKDHFGVTVNDVMLAAATTALRSELQRRDSLPERPLVGMIPISERPAGDAELSNRVAAMMVGLPTEIADPVERLHGVHELANLAKERYAKRGTGVLEGWAAMVPPVLVRLGAGAISATGIADVIPPLFNTIVSNMPGPPIPLYLAGARVTHLYPMGPLFETCGLNITLMSHDGMIDVGVLTCPEMVDDPTRLADGFLGAIDELKGLVPTP